MEKNYRFASRYRLLFFKNVRFEPNPHERYKKLYTRFGKVELLRKAMMGIVSVRHGSDAHVRRTLVGDVVDFNIFYRKTNISAKRTNRSNFTRS